MLQFFRTYQRYFFIVIAVVIVISFSFFGTQYTLNGPKRAEDHPIGMALDGSKMMRNEMDRMVRFLWSDRSDLTLSEKRIMPNFFNDGVVRNDLLGSGIGVLLVEAYFDELKVELTERMKRHKEFRPYHHPNAPFISVENLWAQVIPSQKVNMESFLNDTDEMTPKTFALLVDLYLGESAFPPNILREYLLFQQKHYNWIEVDPALERANLNLFQCRTVEDWFGPKFMELCAQFISNAALLAKQKGYKVSYQEARVDLVRNGYDSLRKERRSGEISEEELGALWKEQLTRLQMDEKGAVQVWQKVMLFRRLFKDVGGALFVDPHLYQTFHGFASKAAEADLYHLPQSLEINNFQSMMKLELYLDLLSSGKRELLILPMSFSSVEEVEKRSPELIEQRFLVEFSEVQREKVALQVTMREMWEWQLERENYALLEEHFPLLALKRAKDAEGYFAALEGIDAQKRHVIDHFSRGQIALLHPEWIESALDGAHLNRREVSFSASGRYLPFDGLMSGEPLLTLLSKCALKGELESDPIALEACKSLELFTSDGERFYRFQVIDRELTKTILTFAEADERGILDALLERELEGAYVKLRKSHRSLFKDDAPLKEVKNEVGRLVYSELLDAIESDGREMKLELPADYHENLDGFYPSCRLYGYMRRAHGDIKRRGDESPFLSQSSQVSREDRLDMKPPLEAQWGLVKAFQLFKNHEKSPWFNSDIFSMVEQSWSDVSLPESGRLSFFQLKEKSLPSSNFSTEMKQGQAILSREAKRLLMHEVLTDLKEKGAIHLHDRS
ncbi:MAG: hypothetical protein K1060chlam2_01186 [Chlamydiae bacterium]|nr:hypothetical protein [Chlamydiota bacterium]